MHNSYFSELNLPFGKDILRDQVILDGRFQRHDTWGLTFIDFREMIKDEVIEFFSDQGLPLRTVYFMYGPPKQELVVHVDGFIDESRNFWGMKCGLNFIFGTQDHKMIWYRSKSLGITSVNKEGLKRTKWNIEDCEEVLHHKIVHPTLVRTSVPHNVINLSDEKRFCVSLRFEDKNLDYESAKEKLQKFIF